MFLAAKNLFLLTIASLFLTVSASAAPILAGYPAPGGTSFSSTGGSPLFGTQSRTYSGFDTNAFDMLWWGPQIGAAFDGAIDAPSETLSVSSGLGTSTLILSGTTSYSGGSVFTRFVATITDGAGVWIDPTTTGLSSGVIPALTKLTGTDPFTVDIALEASANGTTWSPFLPFFNNAQTGPGESGNATSSIGGDFYYTEPNVVPLPAALPLMLAGFGILALIGRRRNSA